MCKYRYSETLKKILKKADIYEKLARKIQFISRVNQEKWFEFAKQYINKDFEFWKKVVFTDESKNNILGSDGKEKVCWKENIEIDTKNFNC